MRPRRWQMSIVVTAALVCSTSGARADERAADLRAHALQLTYSLDYDDARRTLLQAIDADPTDPASYRQLASVNWLQMLFTSGAVLVDDYLGDVAGNVARPTPPADLDAGFHDAIAKAIALAEHRVRTRPSEADAHYQLGAALGYAASYAATIEGRVLGGYRSAHRAYDEHERVLAIDPARKDAGFVVGLYRYAVSQLPFQWRLLAHLVGFGGGRDRGLRMVEEASAYSAEVRPQARFVLIVMYSREARFDEALQVIDQLQQTYPSNRLLWLEGASTALRAGRADEARRQIDTGLAMLARDPRPRAFGEAARWHLYHGLTLGALHDAGGARRELAAALGVDAPGWVHDRARAALRTYVGS